MIFLAIAALCAVIYVIDTLVARWLRSRIPEASTFEETIAYANHPYVIARCWVVLLSFFFIITTDVGIGMLALQTSLPLAILGILFCSFFVLTELMYRSVELFAVKRVLIPRYQQKPGEALQVAISGFAAVVEALYFVLLMGYGLGSALLAIAIWPLGGWAIVASVALLANTVQNFLRILEMYVGLPGLATFNYRYYALMTCSIWSTVALSLAIESHVLFH